MRDFIYMIYSYNFCSREVSESPKRSLMDSPSPTREQKARQAVAEATASAGSKWKMQIGPGVPASTRFKKKAEREEWMEEQHQMARLHSFYYALYYLLLDPTNFPSQKLNEQTDKKEF